MNAADFRTLRDAFHALIELAPDARETHLAHLATQDRELHEAVRGLLVNLAETDLQAPESGGAAPPVQIGPYRLQQLLGSGGMGEVYLAERVDGGFEQRVALKLVRHGGLSRQLTRRFLRERQILARLDHPNIARLLDGGFTPAGQPWLAMDYVAGATIAVYARQHQLGLDARVALVARVAAAVAYAQRNLVVHRDIKPANILVGSDGEPKLLDFGIAKLLDDSSDEQTRTGLRAMTTRYAAPEQIAGERTTTATDVYALGLLLFELVSGCSPYAAADAGSGDWASAIMREPPRSLLQVCKVDYAPRQRHRLGGGLERIVQKALAKPPALRYAGAAALADDLDDWLAQRPLRSGIGGAREQTRQLLARYRWPLIVAAATMLALGAGAVVALRQARAAAEQARIARAHLEAMLGVLGAANPQYYAGRDPHASEFLRTAAETLQRERADDPALLQRALSEIGHGLINLGKPHEAEQVLRAAAVQLERDNSATAAGKLGTYKLLAAVQDEPAFRDGLRATAERIAALAADVDVAVAVDALGGVAGSLGKLGEFEQASRLFARGDALLAQAGNLRPGAVENYWRQRGWTALRVFELDRARSSLLQALAQIEAAPQAFSAMRRAEAELLLAETLLAQSDAAAAQPHLAAAQVVYYAEFPAGHRERAVFDLQNSYLLLLQGNVAAAQATLAAATQVLDQTPVAGKDALMRDWLLADLAAQRGDCAAAKTNLASAAQRLATLQPALPRDRALLAAAAGRVAAACGAQR
ncbi:serine/threonine-protein kinase [Tahibacter aquaticus]|uniref:Serine/threonine-protein kinase n=1 Tax=Tahibacter aquaticus TaxID=520092 RepID=A0A4R6YWJ4_9GAMM|nr:serine/threonine-protein kinase [Tahibacter aquaticus]TDR43155.1 serine/threonine-protein kinase [Tahibacter aquaticus]